MTEQNKTPLTAQPGSVPPPECKPSEKPLRRVGSLTLGACLIAAGVFFLLYFFVPGFDVQLTLKIAPAVALVLLGCEVLFFAARPGRWKYDFVSVLVCLVLMAGCFCMAMLPMLWDELSGENQQTMNRLYDGILNTKKTTNSIHIISCVNLAKISELFLLEQQFLCRGC